MTWLRRLFGGSKQEAIDGSKPSGRVDAASEDRPASGPPDVTTPPKPMAPAMPLQTRPLEPPRTFATPQASRRIRFGQTTDTGRVRSNNQDGSITLVTNAEVAGDPPAIALFIVADGMGGHKDGEYASAVTIQTITRHVMSDIILPGIQNRDMLSSDQKTIPEVLAEAMEAANLAVQQQVPNGGTTATCAVIRGDLAYIAHVGDTRAYLVTDGHMELVTRDHSLVQRLKELGQLTDEEAEVHPQRNVLYRAIGQGDTLEVDAATRRLPPSSRIVICSDGLWGVIGDDQMAEILRECEDPQEACDRMVQAANESGGPDNITVLIAQMPD